MQSEQNSPPLHWHPARQCDFQPAEQVVCMCCCQCGRAENSPFDFCPRWLLLLKFKLQIARFPNAVSYKSKLIYDLSLSSFANNTCSKKAYVTNH